jgi:two-component system, cell cycle response regulator DivK
MAKLLFVEDNLDIRRLLVKRLKRRGFEIVEADNGEEGVQKARSEHPDLILMDMAMPVMDGLEATTRIRQEAEIEAIPIIALTAFSDDGKRKAAMEAGCNDYVTKPIQFQGLLAKIQTWLEEAN